MRAPPGKSPLGSHARSYRKNVYRNTAAGCPDKHPTLQGRFTKTNNLQPLAAALDRAARTTPQHFVIFFTKSVVANAVAGMRDGRLDIESFRGSHHAKNTFG